jgi:photosystem II stability/assembly factor-like uncharacterized protein
MGGTTQWLRARAIAAGRRLFDSLRRMRPSPLAAALAALSLTMAAGANGRFPAAQHVVIGPGAASDVVALRVTFGLVLSRDGGRTWRWMCEEGMFYPFVPAMNFDAPIEVSSRGSTVWGYEVGIRSTDDGCKADDARGAAMHTFVDLTATPRGDTIFAIESGQGVPNAVYRGGEGLEFQRLGAGVSNVEFDTIEVAPSDPRRLYVTGRDTFTFLPKLFRSDDGGATLEPLTPTTPAADSWWIAGVDPTAPDTLFLRAPSGLTTELRRSRDGGRSFQRVATSDDPMLGFAISDDGRTVWYGSIAGGLHRSDDGGDTFRQVNTLPVLCLRQHAGALWACSDWVSHDFALGRSRDNGATFEPMLRLGDFSTFRGPPVCDRRSEGADFCVERWPMMQRTLQSPDDPDASLAPPDVFRRDAAVRDAPRDVSMDALLDAGPPAAPPPPADGCRCAAAGSRAREGATPAALLCAAGLAARRRRRR